MHLQEIHESIAMLSAAADRKVWNYRSKYRLVPYHRWNLWYACRGKFGCVIQIRIKGDRRHKGSV